MFIPISFALSDILWKCTFTIDLILCLKLLKSFKDGDRDGGCSGLAVTCCISVEMLAVMSFIVAVIDFCPLSRVFRRSSKVSLCFHIFSMSSARDSRFDCVLWTMLCSGVTARGFWWWDWICLLFSGVVVCDVKVETVVFCIAGVINWHGHNETLIAMYNKTQPGCRMTSPDNILTIVQNVISFVDDNKLMWSFPVATTLVEAMWLCTASINFWSRSLEITGGKLEPKKSKMQFLTFDFNTYSYSKHYPNRGAPIMKKTAEQNRECVLYGSTADERWPIEKIEPYRGRKLLGVQLAADGNCTDEFKARKE